MRIIDKKVIITAAASGMGKAGVERFANEGARIAAIDRDAERLQEVVDKVNAGGGQAKGFVADLSDAADALKATKAALEWLDGVDVLWSHAGMPAPSDIENFNLEEYRVSADVNLTSSALIAAEAIRDMRSKNGGSIIFTASSAGLVGSALSPLYSALKFGVVGLAKGLAVRYAEDGIRVNAICPGPVATPMLYNDFMKSDPRFTQKENEERVIASVPMGRAAEPREIADAALWLASDESSFVTGIALPVDGGSTAR
ncbi:3-oxoacyl-ACP reductase [Pseudarthrobacter sulfonivorans]|uniref:SDR family NAD(P)-dependent oxidoreductase n=1 Tax=Pseudarthrobacter sulfonivorans TaxID=121292 RepID=UPI00168A90D3|nr:SDR family oxidoreductase [Pseudarthrobacter sulfonivorans]